MRKLILAINLWLLGSLTVFAQQPAWVMSHPVESDAYVGIGFAVLEDPDYIQKATQNALNDIVGQIQNMLTVALCVFRRNEPTIEALPEPVNFFAKL